MSNLDQDLFQQLLNTFRAEAAEHLETINQSLLKLERHPEKPDQEKLVQDAFRAAHSLKGAARAVSLPEIEALAHSMESVLQQARDQGLTLDANACDILYETVDVIGQLITGDTLDIAPLNTRLKAIIGETAPETADPSAADPVTFTEAPRHTETPATTAINEETIRVSVAKLDDLMAQVGELLVSKINAEQRLTDINQISYQLDLWNTTWRELKGLIPHLAGDSGRKIADVLDRHAEHMQNLNQNITKYRQDSSRDTVRLSMVTSDLQDRVRHVRMVPFQTLVLGLERAVRDAARSDGKHIAFRVDGSDVELDKKVLEMLKDPLLHLLRNAVSHGIETPAERKAAGKLPEGHVSLTVRQRGSEVRIVVSDDGHGFNMDRLRQVAVERGTLANAENATDDEILSQAFLPGISTALAITTISGRGVGLDVVRQRLESIQGRISIHNRPQEGVSIELIVPTSLAMTRGLMVRVGQERYVIPLLAIETITTPDEVVVVGGKTMLTINGTPLPLVSLAAVLERANADTTQNAFVVVLAVSDQRLAILVDEVLTEQEIAVKAVGKPLQRVRNVTGAALLGSGEPIIVLNPADLIKSARRSHTGQVRIRATNAPEAQNHSAHILVVDDSITTRTLEKNILEVAGYQVTTATHGIEALKRLKENQIDLIVSDIQMPNMDGFELTVYLRDSSEYGDIPIILVTSLESREDRERGMLSGANAYIVKRGFDQAELLATIQKYL